MEAAQPLPGHTGEAQVSGSSGRRTRRLNGSRATSTQCAEAPSLNERRRRFPDSRSHSSWSGHRRCRGPLGVHVFATKMLPHRTYVDGRRVLLNPNDLRGTAIQNRQNR